MCIIFLAETPKLWKVSDLTIEMKLWYNLHFVKFVSNKYIYIITLENSLLFTDFTHL